MLLGNIGEKVCLAIPVHLSRGGGVLDLGNSVELGGDLLPVLIHTALLEAAAGLES